MIKILFIGLIKFVIFVCVLLMILLIVYLIIPHDKKYSEEHKKLCIIKDDSLKGRFYHFWREFEDFGEYCNHKFDFENVEYKWENGTNLLWIPSQKVSLGEMNGDFKIISFDSKRNNLPIYQCMKCKEKGFDEFKNHYAPQNYEERIDLH